MTGANPFQPKVLSAKLIPSPHAELVGALKGSKKEVVSYGVISADFDAALFVALDEATKASPVHVMYARSLYPSSPLECSSLAGEAIGMLAGADDEIVREGLKAAIRTIETSTRCFRAAGSAQTLYFSHVISSLGYYLSKEAGLSPGDAMAYLLAPPVESLVALDAALKASDVRLVKHFAPPMETNRGGALLTGELEDVQAAAFAFASTVESFAQAPIDPLSHYTFQRRPRA